MKPPLVRPAAAALLVGSDFKALAAARSLSRRGVRVAIVDSDPRAAWYSRHVRTRISWHSGLDDPALVDRLLKCAGEEGLVGAVVFPMQDEGVELVSLYHQRLSAAYVLTTPPWDVLRRAQEKTLAYQAADVAGIDHPVTWEPVDATDLRRLPIRFPAIVKPSTSTKLVRAIHRKALLATTLEELTELYTLALRHVPAGELLVQEFIPGGGENQYSFCALVVEGGIRASMTARRLRQYPIDFGMSSSLVEAVEVPELTEPAKRLLKELSYSGLVELEFKRHPETGSFHLLDINVRAWAWHSLCSACGIDFIDLQYRQATGEPLPNLQPRYGVRWRRVLTDIPAGVASIRARRITISSYLRSLRGTTTYSVLDLSDPMPSLADLPVAAIRLLHRSSTKPDQTQTRMRHPDAVEGIGLDTAKKGLILRRMRQDDAPGLVDLHQRNFPDDLFTFAGPRVLAALFEDLAGEISLVATQDGRLVGYAVGALNKTRFMRCLVQRHPFTITAGAFAAIVRHPGVAFQYFRGFLRWMGRRQSTSDEHAAVSMYEAIVKDAKALGVSPLFFLELHAIWIAYAEESGARRIEGQVTDPRMLGALSRLGYKVNRTTESNGRKKYYISCQLPSDGVRNWTSGMSHRSSWFAEAL